MTNLFFYRRDLFIGSISAAMLGPLSWASLFDWLKAYLDAGGSWRALVVSAALISIYSGVRAAVDVTSDLVEWKRGLSLFSASLKEGSVENTQFSARFAWLIEVEAILVGVGVTLSFVALYVFGDAIQGLDSFESFCAMMNPIGGLILACRNQEGLYPFRFCMEAS